MTFDEANKIVEAFDEDPELEDWMPDSKVYEIIEGLREKYAPTVEMTKEQYKIFNEDIQLNQKALDDYIDESMGLPKITNRQMLNLYTHPDLIKTVDE